MKSKTELARWAQAKIVDRRGANPVFLQDGGESVMVFGTIGSLGCITRHGDIYLEEDSFDPEPGTFVRRSDRAACVTVLILGARRYPELAEWLPERGPDAKTCVRCGGAVDDLSPPCVVCGGSGWL